MAKPKSISFAPKILSCTGTNPDVTRITEEEK
jgi:hypothetical protein